MKRSGIAQIEATGGRRIRMIRRHQERNSDGKKAQMDEKEIFRTPSAFPWQSNMYEVGRNIIFSPKLERVPVSAAGIDDDPRVITTRGREYWRRQGLKSSCRQ